MVKGHVERVWVGVVVEEEARVVLRVRRRTRSWWSRMLLGGERNALVDGGGGRLGIEVEVEVEAFVDFESKSFAMVTMLYVLLTLGDVAS